MHCRWIKLKVPLPCKLIPVSENSDLLCKINWSLPLYLPPPPQKDLNHSSSIPLFEKVVPPTPPQLGEHILPTQHSISKNGPSWSLLKSNWSLNCMNSKLPLDNSFLKTFLKHWKIFKCDQTRNTPTRILILRIQEKIAAMLLINCSSCNCFTYYNCLATCSYMLEKLYLLKLIMTILIRKTFLGLLFWFLGIENNLDWSCSHFLPSF